MNIEYIELIKPRMSDINYGGHVGHTELINLLHEIRARFLHRYSLKETNIDGHLLVMRHLAFTYKNQIFWDNTLEIKMQMKVDGVKIIFNYTVFNTTLSNESVTGETTMVLLNKEKGKPSRPEILIRMLKNDNREGKNKY